MFLRISNAAPIIVCGECQTMNVALKRRDIKLGNGE
jgi:hypothetical protein